MISLDAMPTEAQGACADRDPELFFTPDPDDPEFDEEQAAANEQAAIDICRSCDPEVRGNCLEYAIVNNIVDGVWGGMTAQGRRIFRIDSNLVPHGTTNGYNNHGCRCDECSEAIAIAHQDKVNPIEGLVAEAEALAS
jgi:hypothetical protein